MTASILGMGQWLPETIRDNDAWPPTFWDRAARRAGDRTLVDIEGPGGDDLCARLTAENLQAEARDPFLGTTRRRVAGADVSAWQAEQRAAEQALLAAGVDPGDIDVVLSWSAIPDRALLPSGPRVAHALGATRAWAVGMEAACATSILQLQVAAGLIESGRARRVLLTQSHLMTRVFPLLHPASPNIGDAATAMVMGQGRGPELLGVHARSEGAYSDAVTWIRGHDEDPPWHQAGPAFALGSKDRAAAQHLVRQTVRMGADTVSALLRRLATPAGALGALASVQPRRWVPGAIAQALGLPADAAPHTFDELAHLGAVGVVVNLMAARDRGLWRPGALIALYAQGAGFTRAAALLRV